MSDVIERLRLAQAAFPVCKDAADEIERLRRVEKAAYRLVMCGLGVEDEMDYYTTLCAHRDMLKAALEEK